VIINHLSTSRKVERIGKEMTIEHQLSIVVSSTQEMRESGKATFKLSHKRTAKY